MPDGPFRECKCRLVYEDSKLGPGSACVLSHPGETQDHGTAKSDLNLSA